MQHCSLAFVSLHTHRIPSSRDILKVILFSETAGYLGVCGEFAYAGIFDPIGDASNYSISRHHVESFVVVIILKEKPDEPISKIIETFG